MSSYPKLSGLLGAPPCVGDEGGELASHYYRARYYDSKLGRFVSEDPARADGTNYYQYVRSSPVNRIDPKGLASGQKCWENEIRLTKIGPCTSRIIDKQGTCRGYQIGGDICKDLEKKIRENGDAELYPAVCPKGEKCQDQKPQDTVEFTSKEKVTVRGCVGYSFAKVCCTLTVELEGTFTGKGKVGCCK